MPGVEAVALAYGVSAAVAWGAADFSGGFATKKSHVFTVVFLSQVVGGVFLAALALVFSGWLPGLRVMLVGGLAGLAGEVGLILLYMGLARGRMGIVAPLSAVVSALLPIAVGAVQAGLPGPLRLVGFAVALVAVWLLAGKGGAQSRITAAEAGCSLGAGLGFGLFMVLIAQISDQAVLWPLVGARFTTAALLGLVFAARGGLPAGPVAGTKVQWLPIAMAGVLDAAGNALFALASRTGRLDVAAVLTSLYPAFTVLLAWLVLRERLAARHWLGVAAALAALGCISA
jgi:drug/metabolite transporter (DMT)-like permease